jgi:hypothetical protein
LPAGARSRSARIDDKDDVHDARTPREFFFLSGVAFVLEPSAFGNDPAVSIRSVPASSPSI